MKKFNSFEEFWPYYLEEHSKPGTRALHFLGTSCFLVGCLAALYFHSAYLFLYGIFAAYGFAWSGHFFIEKNRPATFRYPFYSLAGDFKMYGRMLRGVGKLKVKG